MNVAATITVYPKGIELELYATGWLTTGGSSYGYSDEPPWVEVEDIELEHASGKKLSKRLDDYIWEKYGDYIHETLVESAE